MACGNKKELIYQQVPLLTEHLRCPICELLLMTKKSEKIMVHGKTHQKSLEISEKLYYCTNCKAGYATKKVIKKIGQDYEDYKAVTFNAQGLSLKKMKARIATVPQRDFCIGIEKPKSGYVHPHDGFKEYLVREEDTSNQVTIYTTSIDSERCPVCDSPIRRNCINILVGQGIAVKWFGKSCNEHFIAKKSIKLQRLLKGNPYSRHIRIDDKYCLNSYFKMKQAFDDEDNADILILLKKKFNPKKELALIIGHETRNMGDNIRVLDYREREAREILTFVFHDKKKQFPVNNELYYLCGIMNKNGSTYSMEPEYLLYDVLIKKDGGYSRSIKSNRYELVDVLLYSPYSGCYELSQATFDKENYEYFMDISVYKNFVSRYGNPDIFLASPQSAGDRLNLREESILHAFGYNVNQQDNLTQKERQNILSEVIDLQLMTQKAIVTLLESLISIRKNQNRYAVACDKWEQDIKYVISYQANPERFIISSK